VKFELNLRKRNTPKTELIADLQKVASGICRAFGLSMFTIDETPHGENGSDNLGS